MSEVKHTPRPWTFCKVQGEHPHLFVCGPEVPTEYGTDTFLTAYVVGTEVEANGNLIAAAPDLLFAIKSLRLQALQSTVNSPENEWGMEALSLANAAISKAEGRS
jgi:hypothetical protein